MASRLPISVLLLARDEAAALPALLESLAFAADVVVVVDAATRDDTASIAERGGARVFVRPLDGFGPQRQFGLAQCHEDWVLWIDADERLDPGGPRVIAETLAAAQADGFRFGRRGWFLGRPIRFCGWQGERVLRLFRRSRARFDDGAVHERVIVEGTIADLPVTLEHLSYETWDEACRKLLQYASANAERLTNERRRVGILDVIARPPLRFARMYLFQLGLLDGARGLLLCMLASTQVFLKYAGRWSAQRTRAPRS